MSWRASQPPIAAISCCRKSSHSKCPSRESASATPNAVRSHGCENLRAPSARGGRSGEPIMLVTAKCSNRDCMVAVLDPGYSHHAFGSDELGELRFAHAVGSGPALRYHEPADLRAAVPGLDFVGRENFEAALLTNDARLARRPRPERRVF